MRPYRFSRRALAPALLAVLAACGGGGGDAGSASGTPPGGGSGPPPPPALSVSALELAQTHVVPEAGLSWTVTNASEKLHAIGGREALALMKLSATDAAHATVEGWLHGAKLGGVALTQPAGLPPTEANGALYASDRYGAVLPAAWLVPGLQLRVVADNYGASEFHAPLIGADAPITLRVLPFYLFGANDSNAPPLTQTGAPDATTIDEIEAKWPVAQLTVGNHPAQRAVWPTLVVGPRQDASGTAQPAYVLSNSSQQKDGFAAMSAVLNVLGGLLAANGEAPGPFQYYAPLLMLDSGGVYHGPGGGLGSVGGDTGVGDTSYSGIFIHEQGHAFGLPHQGEAYAAGKYPYVGGSLNGSVWGYDPHHREFLSTLVPPTASSYAHCHADTFNGYPRQQDAAGNCIKQDPMQSGAGEQDPHYRFATFSDYSTGMMQRHLEGSTTLNSDGTHSYSGGSIVADASFPDGYKRWDGIDLKWVDFKPVTTSGGIFGFDQGLPLQKAVPVYAIVVTLSNAGTAGATQIYPPLAFTGNLMRTIDPSDANQRASIVPDTSTYYWYCRNGGCDYTLRVTYADSTVRHVLLQGGFRPFNQPTGTPPASASDATNGNSFRTFVVNVPNDAAIQKLELLSTPMVWNGMPASPAVLATR